MTVLSAALPKEPFRFSLPTRLNLLKEAEPDRLLGLAVVHLWRFILVTGFALTLFGAERAHVGTNADVVRTTLDAHAAGSV